MTCPSPSDHSSEHRAPLITIQTEIDEDQPAPERIQKLSLMLDEMKNSANDNDIQKGIEQSMQVAKEIMPEDAKK